MMEKKIIYHLGSYYAVCGQKGDIETSSSSDVVSCKKCIKTANSKKYKKFTGQTVD